MLMKFNRGQVISFMSLVMLHNIDTEFEIVDTNDKGEHAIKCTWHWLDQKGEPQSASNVVRLETGGGWHVLGGGELKRQIGAADPETIEPTG